MCLERAPEPTFSRSDHACRGLRLTKVTAGRKSYHKTKEGKGSAWEYFFSLKQSIDINNMYICVYVCLCAKAELYLVQGAQCQLLAVALPCRPPALAII